MLENETFENVFAKAAKEERGWCGDVRKIEEKIRYLRRDAFVHDPLLSVFMANKKKPHHKRQILVLIV